MSARNPLWAWLFALWLAAPLTARAEPGAVAVLYFDNTGNPELEPLKVGLAELLIADLQGTPEVDVVERTRLQEVLNELDLGHSGVVDPATAARVGKVLGARWLVLGSYFELLGTLQVSAKLVEVETSAIVHAQVERDKPRAFTELEGKLAKGLREALTSQTSPEAPPATRRDRRGDRGSADAAEASPTQAVVAGDADALKAAIAFSEGLIFLDQDDVSRARDSFAAAVEADPNLDAAQAQLANLSL